MEERKRGTEFPVCRGIEIMVAEKIVDRVLERSATEAEGQEQGHGQEQGRGRARGEAPSPPPTTGALGEAGRRMSKSAGKIATNMYKHASFIGDSIYSVFAGRR